MRKKAVTELACEWLSFVLVDNFKIKSDESEKDKFMFQIEDFTENAR